MSKRSAIVAFTTIILLMSAAAAQGLAGSNTVFSDDIVDGQVKHIDIKENTIGSSRMLDNSVHSIKISDGSIVAGDMSDGAVTTPKVADNAVTGAKIADGNVSGADLNNSGNETIDFDPINANSCASENIISGSFPPGQFTDDAAFVTASSAWPNGLSIHTENFSQVIPTISSGIRIVACNVTGAQIDPPSTNFDWAVVDTE